MIKNSIFAVAKSQWVVIFNMKYVDNVVNGLFVYRLGRKIFILERGVRFPYGLRSQLKIEN